MTAILLALALLTDTGPWQAFSDWFSKEGTPGPPPMVFQAYGTRLKAQGIADADVKVRLKELQEYAAGHSKEALTLHFNRIFTWPNAPFSREPSEFLKRAAAGRKPGRVLDIAMGQGRNSIWLAKNGWTVSGYDISDEALRQAKTAAEAAGVALDVKLASHDEYELGQSQWDLILMSFAFTNLDDKAYLQRVRDSLKPGGVLVIEGFGSGPDKETNQMLKSFLDYRVLLFEDVPGISDWGKIKTPLLHMALEKR